MNKPLFSTDLDDALLEVSKQLKKELLEHKNTKDSFLSDCCVFKGTFASLKAEIIKRIYKQFGNYYGNEAYRCKPQEVSQSLETLEKTITYQKLLSVYFKLTPEDSAFVQKNTPSFANLPVVSLYSLSPFQQNFLAHLRKRYGHLRSHNYNYPQSFDPEQFKNPSKKNHYYQYTPDGYVRTVRKQLLDWIEQGVLQNKIEEQSQSLTLTLQDVRAKIKDDMELTANHEVSSEERIRSQDEFEQIITADFLADTLFESSCSQLDTPLSRLNSPVIRTILDACNTYVVGMAVKADIYNSGWNI